MKVSKEQNQAIDRLRAIIDNERVGTKIRSYLEDDLSADELQSGADEVRQRADEIRATVTELEAQADQIESTASTLEALVDAQGTALEHFEEWEEAEDRETKQDAREALLAALQVLVEAYDRAVEQEAAEPELNEETASVGRVHWDGERWRVFDVDGYDIVPPDEGTENIWCNH